MRCCSHGWKRLQLWCSGIFTGVYCLLDCIALWGEGGGRWELGGHEVNRGECDKGCFAIQGGVNKYSFSVLELVGGWEGGKQGVHSIIGVRLW